MNRISSSAFRTQYPKLTEPTEVTVVGRVIGVWTPVGAALPHPADAWVPDDSPSDPAPREEAFGAVAKPVRPAKRKPSIDLTRRAE